MSLRPRPIRLPCLPTRRCVFVILTTVIVQFVAGYYCWRWFADPENLNLRSGPLLAALTVIPAAAGLAWIWFQAVWSEPGGWAGLGLTRPAPGFFGLALLAGTVAMALNLITTAVFLPILGQPTALPVHGEGGIMASGPATVLFFVFGALFLAPLLEEVLFRGILFARLRRHFGFWPAAALAAAAHAAVHFQLSTMPGLLAVFIIFAYLYERSGNIWLPTAAHGTHNLLVLVVALFQQSG